ncbi:hypothetical protein AVEN_161168-1 [Araneus ventricosus]|uniref:Uncharacterized protein n=1 Tax=Araneus ventricosus TaxID=182803 RepID=A0A4Y2VEN3_ARAVE|nr:hypothetical protein AVEN_161168-1 [Araneus ventricosus]
MTDFCNLDMSYGGNPFLVPDGHPRDATLDASQVLAAALEQMDDIIAATNHELEVQALEKKNSAISESLNTSNELFCSNTFFPVKVSDAQESDSTLSVNRILENLKDCILANDGNDNFVPNQEFSISSAKIVFNWLHKQFEDKAAGDEVMSQVFLQSDNTFVGYKPGFGVGNGFN